MKIKGIRVREFTEEKSYDSDKIKAWKWRNISEEDKKQIEDIVENYRGKFVVEAKGKIYKGRKGSIKLYNEKELGGEEGVIENLELCIRLLK